MSINPEWDSHEQRANPDGSAYCTCGDTHCASLDTLPEFIKVSERDFDLNYKPIDAPSGEPTWTFQEVKAAEIPKHRVWTIVETGDPEDESWYAIPGYHIVNKIDYAVTEKPWEHEHIEAVWFLDDFEKEN